MRNLPEKAIAAVACAALLFAAPAAAQILGQLATTAPAAEGEGALFLFAGNDAFRTGASVRFNVSRFADFGLQFGLDRACGRSLVGGGADIKLTLLESRPELPIGLALDAAAGRLDAKKDPRNRFDIGVLASGTIPRTAGSPVEPYASFVVRIERFDCEYDRRAPACGRCPREAGDDRTETDTLVRAGARIPLGRWSQLFLEGEFGDRALLGAGVNVVF